MLMKNTIKEVFGTNSTKELSSKPLFLFIIASGVVAVLGACAFFYFAGVQNWTIWNILK